MSLEGGFLRWSWSGTARPRPGSLFDAPDFRQVFHIVLLDLFRDFVRRDVRSTELAFDVAKTFRVKTGAHESVLLDIDRWLM